MAFHQLFDHVLRCRIADDVVILEGVLRQVEELAGSDPALSIAEPSAALGEVHTVIRGRVPRMDVDREVAIQIAEVNDLLPKVCATAAAETRGLR